MAEESRRKPLFITFFLLIVLIPSAYVSLVPIVHAAEAAIQEKGFTILRDVVGLDLTKYAITTEEHLEDPYLGVLPQENVGFILESSESRLRVACTFVNKTLQLIYLSDCDGLPYMTLPATCDPLEMAKGFLSRYYAYSGASYIQEMHSMLDELYANKNITKTSNNVKLEVMVNQMRTEFVWTYTFNGVQANSKRVSLSFEKGFLKHFLDHWWLYKIGSTDINIDEKEAIEIAINAAKNYVWEVKEFNIVAIGKPTLSILNYMNKEEARGGDPFTLYPEWFIPLGFDKVYLGGVTGINVGVWADTGEVSYIGLMTFGGAPPSNQDTIEPPPNKDSNEDVDTNPIPATWIIIPILIAITLGAIVVYSGSKNLMCRNVPKSNRLKLGGALLLLISLTTISIPTANAVSLPEPRGSAITYASTYGQPSYERTAAQQICADLASRFGQEGYEVTNAFDADTTKSNVLSWASSKVVSASRTARMDGVSSSSAFSVFHAEVTENSWTTKASMPSAMSGHGAVVVNGKIYAIGHNATYEYDPVTDTWAIKKPMPTTRVSFAVAACQGKIYVIGGYITWEQVTGTNEVYDPLTDTWETKRAMPTPRAQLGANVVDGKIYLIGGRTGGPDSTVPLNEVYDPAADSWTTKASIPYPVVEYASAVVDNKIFIIGGQDEFHPDLNVAFNQIYDSKTDTWSFGAPIPTAVWQTAAGATTGVMAPKRIYVIGGLPDGNLLGTNITQVYNPENDTWTFGAPMPTPRCGLAVAVVNDVLYALGGTWMALNLQSPIYAVNEQYIPFGFRTTSPNPFNGNQQPEPSNGTQQSEPLPITWIMGAVAITATSVAVITLSVVTHKRRKSKAPLQQ